MDQGADAERERQVVRPAGAALTGGTVFRKARIASESARVTRVVYGYGIAG